MEPSARHTTVPAVPPMLAGLALMLALLLAACGGALPPAAPTTTAMPRTQTITVPAAAGWVETGAIIAPGNRLVIAAEGTVVLIDGGGPITAAGGAIRCDRDKAEARAGMRFDLACLLDGAPFGAVIGRIGDGPPFLIGSAADLTADRGGPLLLAVNDCCSLDDNAGAFSVTLVRYAS